LYNNAGTWQREYVIKDHLGDTRIAYADINGDGVIATPSEILQENNYDAFGYGLDGVYMNHSNPDNLYQYNGKEKNDDHGIGMYDYGARWYDASIGRFSTIDRFSEKYFVLTPYQYGANNPIRYIDYNGDSLLMFKNGVYVATVDDGKKEFSGFNQQSVINKNGTETFTGGQSFGFNDIASDISDIRTKKLKLRFVDNAEIDKNMESSGVNDQNNKNKAWSYIERESRPTSDDPILSSQKSSGRMDYQTYTVTNSNSLNVVGGIVYNNPDYGNFLWGQGGKRLGFKYATLRIAS
jgi:RHS repeat-associated protein